MEARMPRYLLALTLMPIPAEQMRTPRHASPRTRASTTPIIVEVDSRPVRKSLSHYIEPPRWTNSTLRLSRLSTTWCTESVRRWPPELP
jgi:hypothetical protein